MKKDFQNTFHDAMDFLGTGMVQIKNQIAPEGLGSEKKRNPYG